MVLAVGGEVRRIDTGEPVTVDSIVNESGQQTVTFSWTDDHGVRKTDSCSVDHFMSTAEPRKG